MNRICGKSCHFIFMMVLATTFFLAKIMMGYTYHDVLLVVDSFHIILDIMSLVVGFVAFKMSMRSSNQNTFGWQRAEIVGALVNSIFLLALCFRISVEAVQHCIVHDHGEVVEDPGVMLKVGVLGLMVNCVGLCLFASNGICSGSSCRTRYGHERPQKARGSASATPMTKVEHDYNHHKTTPQIHPTPDLGYIHLRDQDENADATLAEMQINGDPPLKKSSVYFPSEEGRSSGDLQMRRTSSAQLNIRGVFLHICGDALASLVVIVSALCIMLADEDWRFYMHPVLSLVMVSFLTLATIPLFKKTSLILLQSIPTYIDIDDLQNRLISKVRCIENIHEFHVWQLSGDIIIATAHIRLRSTEDYVQNAKDIKTFLHNEGIHSTTIQPEFPQDMIGCRTDSGSSCILMCPSVTCQSKTCCANNVKN